MTSGMRGTSRAIALVLLAAGCRGSLYAGAGAQGGTLPPEPVQPEPVAQGSLTVDVRISFFGVPLDGADDVVFVLDRSGSMSGVSAGVAGEAVGMSQGQALVAGLGATLANHAAGHPLPSKMQAAREELIHTLDTMPDGTRVGVIFFDDELDALAPTLFVLDSRSRAGAAAFIRGIKPRGTTAAVPAMRLAYQMGARRVILLSDGLANTGGSGGDLLAEARPQMARGLRIDTVGLGIDQDSALMRTLAAESGGLAVMR
jgi:VWA domain-containing protein